VEELLQRLSFILSYVKKIVRDGWVAQFPMYCALNNFVSCGNEVTWPSGRLMNQSIVFPVRVLMNNLHLTASEPPISIICMWKAVRWASKSPVPVKVT